MLLKYGLIGSISLSVFLIIFIIYNIVSNRKFAKLSYKSIEEKTLDVAKLTDEKNLLSNQLLELQNKNYYLEKLIQEFDKLKEESKELTKAALHDLGANLSKQLIDIHKSENQESRSLSEKTIKDTTSKFNSEFEKIVSIIGSLNREISNSKDTVEIIKNSLLSPSGAGSLAEITLENILKSSGLKNGIDYKMQYNISDIVTETNLRPDCVIFLPGDKLMVVDAKASKFLVDDLNDNNNLSKSMNNHLKNLSNKSYSEALRKSLNSSSQKSLNIVTLMFLPSEHAIEKILDCDKEFMYKAWNANIFPVGPAGLMNMLSFAKFQISEQLMIQNNLKIIEEVKKLLSSVATMADHSSKLGNSLSSAINHYDRFAASFNSNFLSKARKLNQMGINSSLKKDQESLRRLQIFISKADIVDVESEDSMEVKLLEDI